MPSVKVRNFAPHFFFLLFKEIGTPVHNATKRTAGEDFYLFVVAVLCGVALVTPVCNHLSLRHFLISRQKIYSLLDM